MTSKQKFSFSISGTSYNIAVETFDVEEQISQLYEVSLKLVSKDKIHFDKVIRKEALLTIAGKDEDRYFHGIINYFMLTGNVDTFYTYQATVVPKVWLLGLNQDFKIFQNITVEDIIKNIFDEKNIPSDEYIFKLKSKYNKRRYCTQYGENDYRFICRILEEEGIFFFFEHDEESHTLIFSDSEDVYSPIEGEYEMDFNIDSNMVAEKETINNFGYNRSICPGIVTHTNYNFKRPTLDMEVTEEGDTNVNHKIYEYPGDYGLPPEGADKVKAHIEQVKSLEESAQGTSNCSRFIPGSIFSISDHPFDDLNDEYCLVMVEHKGNQPNVFGENSGIGGDYYYSNYFIAIPADTVYRTRKTLKKPYVRGLQSAIVTGPEGHEIHTDEYGRIKVQFHWDREGEKNDKSSCWLRTNQPWSGNGWGMVSLPRVGNEVLVAFINGDPDWPIMVGNVNNAASPALYDLPANKTQSGIKTRSTPGGGPDNFNELRFEDQKGSEEVYLQAEKNWNVLVKSRKGQTVGGESGTVIGKNCDKKVGGDSYTIVTGKQTEIANEIIIGADTKITIVSGNSFIEISPAGIKINGPKVDINDGSSAPSLEKRPVTGSTGKTSGGGGGKSGESPPSPKQSAKKASKPEPAIPASKPEAAKPDDGWKAGPVKDVEVEAAEGDGRGWTEVPAGGWPDTSKLPSGGWDEKLPVGMPAADKWTLGSVSDKASGLGDFASSGSSSVLGKSGVSGAGDLVSSASSKSAGLQANIAEARSTIGNAGSIKDAAISGVKNRANEALNSTANKMLDKTGIPGTQTNAAQELTNLGSLLKKPEIA